MTSRGSDLKANKKKCEETSRRSEIAILRLSTPVVRRDQDGGHVRKVGPNDSRFFNPFRRSIVSAPKRCSFDMHFMPKSRSPKSNVYQLLISP